MAFRIALSLLLVSALAAGQPLDGGDSPYADIINKVITDTNNFLEDHQLDEKALPDIGTNAVKLTDGKLGKMNTITLNGAPTVTSKTTTDGSTIYTFDVPLSFEVLVWSYQYHVKILSLVSRDGNLTLTPDSNSFRIQGYTTLKKDGTCFSRATSLKLENLGKLKLALTPDDIPDLSTIAEAILNFAASNLKPSTNVAFAALLLDPERQQQFSDLVCQGVSESV